MTLQRAQTGVHPSVFKNIPTWKCDLEEKTKWDYLKEIISGAIALLDMPDYQHHCLPVTQSETSGLSWSSQQDCIELAEF